LLMISLPIFFIDFVYYNDIVFACWNIIKYNTPFFNSFRDEESGYDGSELYGTEPFHFYFLNNSLNMNIAFVLSLLSLPLILITRWLFPHLISFAYPIADDIIVTVVPFYIWFFAFSSLPHKEERFMFVIYPLASLSAAIALRCAMDILDSIFFRIFNGKRAGPQPKTPSTMVASTIVPAVVLLLSFLLSTSRIASSYNNYYAPIHAYKLFYVKESRRPSNHEVGSEGMYNLCIGKEWHRFPSHFFIPTDKFHVHFLKSEFTGQLPQHYSTSNAVDKNMTKSSRRSGGNGDNDATSRIPAGFNSLNREEPSRYLPLQKCHYIVDASVHNQKEENYSKRKDFDTIVSFPFLDVAASPNSLARAFYIPYYSYRHNDFTLYKILRRKY
jgi:alpha-1,2-mannosyltransferase